MLTYEEITPIVAEDEDMDEEDMDEEFGDDDMGEVEDEDEE